MDTQTKKDLTRLKNLVLKYRDAIITRTAQRIGDNHLIQIVEEYDTTLNMIKKYYEGY